MEEVLSRCVPRLAAAGHSTLPLFVAGTSVRKLLGSAFRPGTWCAIAEAPQTAVPFRLGTRQFHHWRAPLPTSCRGDNNNDTTLTLPATFPLGGRAPHQHSTSTGARGCGRGHTTCALAADGGHSGGNISTLDTLTSNTTTASVNMADRNVLPDHFRPAHYDLVLTALDFKNWSYNGSVTYEILPRPVASFSERMDRLSVNTCHDPVSS